MPRLTSAKLSQLAIHKDGQKGSICGWGKNPAVVDQRNALESLPTLWMAGPRTSCCSLAFILLLGSTLPYLLTIA